jgi:hypothetical protein
LSCSDPCDAVVAGLQILVAQMKSEANQEKKDSVRAVVTAYMSKAEALKKTIKAHQQGPAAGGGAGSGSRVSASTPMFLRSKSASVEGKRGQQESKEAKEETKEKDVSGIDPKLRAQIEGACRADSCVLQFESFPRSQAKSWMEELG